MEPERGREEMDRGREREKEAERWMRGEEVMQWRAVLMLTEAVMERRWDRRCVCLWTAEATKATAFHRDIRERQGTERERERENEMLL